MSASEFKDLEAKFAYAMSGLSWAVGRLGEDGGYAARVHEVLTHPVIRVDLNRDDE